MSRNSSLLPLAAISGAAIVMSFAGACSNKSNATALTVDTFLKSYDDAFCQFLIRCGEVPDAASCKTAVGPDPTMAQGVSSVVFGTLQFDATAGQACLDSIKNAMCQTVIGGPTEKSIAKACSAAFTQKGKTGDACFIGLECASGFCDAKAGCGSDCCIGKCTDVSTDVADGGVCIDPMTGIVSACVAGDFCNASTKKCEKQAQPNAMCSQPNACVEGYSCDTGTKLCFNPAASGAKCNPMLTGSCESLGEYCDATKMVCTKLPGAGQPCVMDMVHNGACARDSACVMNTCTLLPSTGEMCTGACLGNLKCDTKNTMKCGPLAEAHTCVAD